MPQTPKPPQDAEREAVVAAALEEGATVIEEAIETNRATVGRLDELSRQLRKHGAFPITHQIDRRDDRRDSGAD